MPTRRSAARGPISMRMMSWPGQTPSSSAKAIGRRRHRGRSRRRRGKPGSSWPRRWDSAFGAFAAAALFARFLNEHRGWYNPADQRFTVEQVLAWADDWHERTGEWPIAVSGKIPGAGGVHWKIVDDSLRTGRGVMPGGSSLSRLLLGQRGVDRRSPLNEEQILTWAHAHRERTGHWPHQDSGSILDEPDESWKAVNNALFKGLRSLPGGSSIPRLLYLRRGVKTPASLRGQPFL